MPVKHQNVALDYIGKRGSAINVGRRERVQYAREILQKEVQRRIPFSAMKVYDDGNIKYLFTVIFYFLFFIFYFLFFQFFFVSVFVRFFPMSVQKKIVRRKKLFLWVTLCIKCLCALQEDWKRMIEIILEKKGNVIIRIMIRLLIRIEIEIETFSFLGSFSLILNDPLFLILFLLVP